MNRKEKQRQKAAESGFANGAEQVCDRRDFLLRTSRAGIAVAAATTLGYWLYDGKGPGAPPSETDSTVLLSDFSLSSLGRRMSIVTGQDRAAALRLAMESLGGIEQFVGKGDRVLIKVNAAFATPPLLSATTNPELVSQMVTLCLKAGAASVLVTDNPINDPESCFTLTGIGEAARSSGARLVLPREGLFRPTTVPDAAFIRNWPLLYAPFEGVTKVIGMAPVKDHHRSGASMSMKNWYGLLGGRRNVFHQNIHEFIVELARMVKPTLVVLDGMTTMMSNGPTGGSLSDLKETNTLIVSTDQVAADAFGAGLLGRSLQELPYILKAEAAGLGTTDFESLKPVRAQVRAGSLG
jgi:uncharacterized protein (DUF362 family)